MRAVFLDRDGVINELVYYPEFGIIDSPFTPAQFKLLPGVARAINKLHTMDYQVVLASNQPGIAKGHFSEEIFNKVCAKMRADLAEEHAFLDVEYYCFHHPQANVESLRADCDCRKPKPGLLFRAAREMGVDLSESWMVGDGLTDIKAGIKAGVRTLLLGQTKCELCHLMDEENARPDAIASDLEEAARLISMMEVKNGDIYRLSQSHRD